MSKYPCICFKCHKSYVSEDVGATDGSDFCPECRELNKKIAQEVDRKLALRPKKEANNSTLDFYNRSRKRKGVTNYINIRDLR